MKSIEVHNEQLKKLLSDYESELAANGYKIFRRKPSGLAPRMKPTMQLILLALQTKLMYHVDVPKWVLDLVSI